MQPVAQSVEFEEADRVTVVIGVDFTEASDYALGWAASLVRSAGSRAELHLVHVAAPPYWPAVHGVDGPAMMMPDSMAMTEKWLLDACFTLGRRAHASIVPHLLVGDATGEIADLARELNADLIVVGAHKRHGLASALHRSTYARLVRSAPCSVLTAMPKEEDLRIEPPCAACVAVRQRSTGAVMWCANHSRPHVHGHMHHGASDPNRSGSWDFRV